MSIQNEDEDYLRDGDEEDFESRLSYFLFAYGDRPVPPFHQACKEGNLEMVKLEMENPDFNPNIQSLEGCTGLFVASFKGHTEIVQFLIADPRVQINLKDRNHRNAFFIACKVGHLKVVELFIRDQRTDFHSKGTDSQSSLYTACRNNHKEIVELLLADERVDVNHVGDVVMTPLSTACYHGHVEIVRLLLADRRVKVNQMKNTYISKSPLHYACEQGRFEVVDLLLKEPSVDVLVKDISGLTPFENVCAFWAFRSEIFLSKIKRGYSIEELNSRNTKVVECFLKSDRIDPNQQQFFQKNTPFLYACKGGSKEVVDLFLKDDRIDVSVLDDRKRNGLYYACFETSGECKETLRVDFPEIYQWILNSNREVVELLLADGRIDPAKCDYRGYSVLHAACHSGKIEVIPPLLEDSRIIDLFSQPTRIDYSSPLHLACFNGNYEIVRLLLNNPLFDPNQLDAEEVTPFHVAASLGRIETCKLLLADERVDVNLALHENKLPFTRVCNSYMSSMMEMIKLFLASHRHFDFEIQKLEKTNLFKSIRHLLLQFTIHPLTTKITLRREFERDGDIFALLLLLSDNYLRLKEDSRFFRMVLKLPLEIQMSICKKIYLSTSLYYPPAKVQKHLKDVISLFSFDLPK